MGCSWVILMLASTPSESATSTLTLGQAVELALRTDPQLGAAEVARERAELAVLRAQLDRFSFRIDAQIQELWAKSNIGGEQVDPSIGDQPSDGGLGLSYAAANLTAPVFSGFRVEST